MKDITSSEIKQKVPMTYSNTILSTEHLLFNKVELRCRWRESNTAEQTSRTLELVTASLAAATKQETVTSSCSIQQHKPGTTRKKKLFTFHIRKAIFRGKKVIPAHNLILSLPCLASLINITKTKHRSNKPAPGCKNYQFIMKLILEKELEGKKWKLNEWKLQNDDTLQESKKQHNSWYSS